MSIPEHVVLQEILPRAYADMSIDTRRHFGLPPRRVSRDASDADCVVERHLRERMDTKKYCDAHILAASVPFSFPVEPGSVHLGLAYDAATVDISFWWNDDAHELRYQIDKNFRRAAGIPCGKYCTQFSISYRVTEYAYWGGRLVSTHERSLASP